MSKIPEGCILLARKIQKSEIWAKPAWWYKVWSYILMEVNHTENGRFKRGEGLFTSRQIFRDCCLSGEGLEENSIENVLKWLRKTGQITTDRTTRGAIITVCNYNAYQTIGNYGGKSKNRTKYRTGNQTETGQEPDDKQESKNDNNDTTLSENATVVPANLPGQSTLQAQFVGCFADLYTSKTGQPFKTDRKHYIIASNLIKEFGLNEVIKKTRLLAGFCDSACMWFTKNGWADFTIEKLSVQWNALIEKETRGGSRWGELFKEIEEEKREQVRNIAE